jgi:hypothetical protein
MTCGLQSATDTASSGLDICIGSSETYSASLFIESIYKNQFRQEELLGKERKKERVS